jgi:acyl-coenzyme A synthetase/AMP-(fatty) acid ligase
VASCHPGEMGTVKARVKPNPDRGEYPWTDHGDVGWTTDHGEVFVVGRTSDINPADFASGATREVAPVYEIEHLLRLEWDSADAAAILVESDNIHSSPEIWVATVDCKDASADQLQQILRRRGIEGTVRLFPVSAIPRGAAGKIQRAQLKSMMSGSGAQTLRQRAP